MTVTTRLPCLQYTRRTRAGDELEWMRTKLEDTAIASESYPNSGFHEQHVNLDTEFRDARRRIGPCTADHGAQMKEVMIGTTVTSYLIYGATAVILRIDTLHSA